MTRFILAIFFATLCSISQTLAQEPAITSKNLFAIIRKLEKTQHATDQQIEQITGRLPIWREPGLCTSEKSANSEITELHTTLSRTGQTMGVLLFVNHDLRISPAEIRQTFGQAPVIRKRPSVGIKSVSLEYEYERKLGWTKFWFEISEKQTLLRYAVIVYRHNEKS